MTYRHGFRGRRLHVGHTQESLALVIGVSVASVSSWERGRRNPSPGQRRPLADALGVSLPDLDRLLGYEVEPPRPPEVVPHWVRHYDSLLREAGALLQVERSAIPPLFQTGDYAAAVERSGPVELTEWEVAARVEDRLSRQRLVRPDGGALSVVAVVSEHVLHDTVGSPSVMADQIRHLSALATRPNLLLRILPRDGRAACAVSNFDLFVPAGGTEPALAVDFAVDGPRYVEHPELLAVFRHSWNHLLDVALAPEASLRLLRGILGTDR